FCAHMEPLFRNDSLRNWLIRYSFFFSGLACFGLGVAISVKMRHWGLHPWDELNIPLVDRFGLSIGTSTIIIGLLLIMISLFVSRKYVNLGTFLNALLIGPFMDFFLWLDILPAPTFTWTDYVWLLVGIVIVGTGGGLY